MRSRRVTLVAFFSNDCFSLFHPSTSNCSSAIFMSEKRSKKKRFTSGDLNRWLKKTLRALMVGPALSHCIPAFERVQNERDGIEPSTSSPTPQRRRPAARPVRVTQPEGRISAVVWDYGDSMFMLRTFWDAAL